MDDDKREEYDVYLASLGQNRARERETHMDPEEIERRRRERGKKRFMEDFDFVNDEFFDMWKQRTGSTQSEEDTRKEELNFNGANILLTVPIQIQKILFEKE